MNELAISGIILFVAVSIILFILKKNNKLKIKKKDKEIDEFEDYEYSGSIFRSLRRFPLANIIGGFVIIMIGTMLLPTITEQINNAYNATSPNTPISETGKTIIDLGTLFFALAVAITVILVIITAFRGLGGL